MLRAIGGRAQDRIVLERASDIIDLCISLQVHIDAQRKLDFYYSGSLECLHRSLDTNRHLHDIEEVKSAFFCLAVLADQCGNYYELARLGITAMYKWSWKTNSPSHSYFIDLLFKRLVLIFPFINDIDREILPELIVDLCKYSNDNLSLFIDSALDMLYVCSVPHWSVTVKMLHSCTIEMADRFAKFGERVWLLWGSNQELILALFDQLLESNINTDTPCLCSWLRLVFEMGGSSAASISSYMISRLFKYIQSRKLTEAQIVRVIDITLCIPSNNSVSNLVQKLYEKIDQNILSSGTSVKLMNLLVKNESSIEAEKLLTVCCESNPNLEVIHAYLSLAPNTLFMSFVDDYTVEKKRQVLKVLHELLTNGCNIDHLLVDVVFNRIISLIQDIISTENDIVLVVDLLKTLFTSALFKKVKTPQWLFDLVSFNNSWIKMSHISRRLPFDLFSAICENYENSELFLKLSVIKVISLADYLICCDLQTNSRITLLDSELYTLFTEHHPEALFAISMIEQVMLKAIQESSKPAWYNDFYMLVAAHLFHRYKSLLTQKSAILRSLAHFRQVDYSILAQLVHSVDFLDATELTRHFLPSEKHVSGFIENLVLAFDAPFVYSVFQILLKKPPNGRVIDMFTDWLFSIGTMDVMNLATPMFLLCGNEEYLLECGKACFRILMSVSDEPMPLFISALLKVFDDCCRRLHPAILFKPPKLPAATIPPIIVPNSTLRHHFILFPDTDSDAPETVEDLFFMLGSLLRTKKQIPIVVADSVSLYFEKLKSAN